MEVFKYRGNYERDLLTLANNQIYAPTYDYLNDPFEGMMHSTRDNETIEFFKLFGGGENLESAYKEIVQMLKKVGVYSLSTDEKNEILWSLYANGHQGFIIAYQLEELLKDFNFNPVMPLVNQVKVKYDTKPSGLLQFKDLPYRGFNLSNAIGVKSKSWEHEKEVRLIFEQNELIDYNFRAVSRIIFGLRAEDKNIDKTMKLLAGRDYKYQKVVKIDNSFDLGIINLEDKYKGVPYRQKTAFFDETLISKEKLLISDDKVIFQIKTIIEQIRELPNITKIISIDIDLENTRGLLNIFCKHNHKNLPVRFFQFKYSENRFIKNN